MNSARICKGSRECIRRSYGEKSYFPRSRSVRSHLKSILTQRKPASAIIFISPGCGSTKWMLTPRPSSTGAAADGADQQLEQSLDLRLRSAEIASERNRAKKVRRNRNFINDAH